MASFLLHPSPAPRAASESTAATPSGPRVGGHLAGLDGLRAIAVLAVLIYHLTPGLLPGGYLGVDVFFVISGFLITSLLLREFDASGRIGLRSFWVRRARRLLPALALVVLTSCAVAWAIGGDVLVSLGQQVLGALTFSSNWLALLGDRSYFDETTPELLRNLWSLGVEEQFYLLWPLLILGLLALRRRWDRAGRRAALGAVAVLAVASAVAMAVLYVPGTDPTRVYYGTDTHSFGLTIGALLALLGVGSGEVGSGGAGAGRSRALAWGLPLLGVAGLAGLAVSTVLLRASDPATYQGGMLMVTLFTAAVIVVATGFGAAGSGTAFGRLLDRQPLRWIGERSYGLYLWHWPVFVLLTAALPHVPRTGSGGWALGAGAAAITVVAATLSYRFVEQPVRRAGFRRSGRLIVDYARASRSRAVTAIGIAATVTLVAAAGATAIVTDPGAGAAQMQIELGRQAVDRQDKAAAPAAPEQAGPDAVAADPSARDGAPAAAPSPEPAPLPGGDQITAIGDSVMLASARLLQAAFPGIAIDAAVSRQLSQAPQLVRQLRDAGTLRPTVLIGLGTNGPIDAAVLDELREIAGPQHQLVLVNVHAPRWWSDGVNAQLADFARKYRNVGLANWRDAIGGQLRLLAGDHIHPGDAGGRVYAEVVRDALQRLAELPPILDRRDYGLAPIPT